MQDIGTSVDYVHAEQSWSLGNLSNLEKKGFTLGKKWSKGVKRECLGRLLCPACSNISFQSVLAN